ncbi:MAG: RidA family protein [Anaerolineales bacterium]|nr:RidA family protein [Anaerolineales bacterium]
MTKTPPYHLFLLGLWAEADGAWRFSLEDARTGERVGFNSLPQLQQFLAQWMQTFSGEKHMDRQMINPWTWQDEFGYVQANAVSGVQRILYCSGQSANDATGAAVHAGDMRAQITLALDNLETLLRAANFTVADIVRLNIYVTDVDKFLENYDAFIERLAGAGCRHAGSLIGVARLAFPEMMIEVEATAVA